MAEKYKMRQKISHKTAQRNYGMLTHQHITPAFCLVEGPDDGLVQSEACRQTLRKRILSCISTDDLSFFRLLTCGREHTTISEN